MLTIGKHSEPILGLPQSELEDFDFGVSAVAVPFCCPRCTCGCRRPPSGGAAYQEEIA